MDLLGNPNQHYTKLEQWLWVRYRAVYLQSSDNRLYALPPPLCIYSCDTNQRATGVLAYGLHRLRRMKIADAEWEPLVLKHHILEWVIALLFAASNLMILSEGAKAKSKPGRYWWPITSACVFGGCFVYWGVLRLWILLSESHNHADSLPIKAHIACEPEDCRTAKQRQELAVARREGNQRIVYYEVPISVATAGTRVLTVSTQFSESFRAKYEAFKRNYVSPLVHFLLR